MPTALDLPPGRPLPSRRCAAPSDVFLRLFAPFIPFATEEVWSWTHDDSVHLAEWPTPPVSEAPSGLLAATSAALIGIRRAKTDAKASQKADVLSATLSAPAEQLDLLRAATGDLCAVGRIADLTLVEGDEISVGDVQLAEPAA